MEKIGEDDYKQVCKKLIKIGLLAVLIAFLITKTIQPARIVGSSMHPTLKEGEYYLINKLNKDFRTGDIIVFRGLDSEYIVKRIIAMDKDELYIIDGNVIVNGNILNEPYIKEKWSSLFSGIIPKDHIFVMGDNRNNSFDSRNIGPIKKKDILGKLLFK